MFFSSSGQTQLLQMSLGQDFYSMSPCFRNDSKRNHIFPLDQEMPQSHNISPVRALLARLRPTAVHLQQAMKFERILRLQGKRPEALDRHEFVEREAYNAQIAYDNNDVRGCFAVVRALHGGKPRAHKTILKKCGEKTQNEDQRKERWQEHWAEVFQGSIIEFHCCRSAQGGSLELCPVLDVSPEAMEVSIAGCRRHKATGRDPGIQRGGASWWQTDG